MRITNSMLVTGFLGDMNRNLTAMNKVMKQLDTGKQFSRPSDDPFRVARSMQMYTEIDANKQFNNNIKDTINWMDTTGEAMKHATNSLQRIRELMVSSGNAAYGSSELKAIQDEINEKVAEFGQILNTSFDGKYIFAGTDSTKRPIEVKEDANSQNKIEIVGDVNNISEKLQVEISSGVVVDYNISATEILKFEDKDGNVTDVSKVLNDILTNLSDPATKDKVVSENLDQIDKIINNMLSLNSKVGTIQNRMESAKEINETQNFNLTEILSGNEDIDFVEKNMELAVIQTVYMAALQTSTKVIQPTILDFLK